MSPDTFSTTHFLWSFADGVARISLDRPERKNPLAFVKQKPVFEGD